jgi:hypothetical protein
VYETASVDIAVASSSVAIRDDRKQEVPRGFTRESKLPQYFSSTLRFLYCEEINFPTFQKKGYGYFYNKFAFCPKLVESTTKSERLRWLKLVDNLKSQPLRVRVTLDGILD